MARGVFSRISFRRALAANKRDGAWLIVFFASRREPHCNMMERLTWPRAPVRGWLRRNGVAVRLELALHRPLVKRLRVTFPPTVIAFRAGKEFDRAVGRNAVEHLAEWLAAIDSGKTAVDTAKQFVGDPARDTSARFGVLEALVDAGRLDEALPEADWLWHHMEEQACTVGVRNSYLVGVIEDLVGRSPAARRRFVAIRNEVEKVRREDWVHLNQALGDDKLTLKWLDTLPDPLARAKAVDGELHLRNLLMDAGRWAEAASFYVDPKRDLAFWRSIARSKISDRRRERRKLLRDAHVQMFRTEAASMHAALLAAGRVDEAREIRRSALRWDPSPKMRRGIDGLTKRAIRGKSRVGFFSFLP